MNAKALFLSVSLLALTLTACNSKKTEEAPMDSTKVDTPAVVTPVDTSASADTSLVKHVDTTIVTHDTTVKPGKPETVKKPAKSTAPSEPTNQEGTTRRNANEPQQGTTRRNVNESQQGQIRRNP
jgi:hypothetical protein